MPSPRAPTGPGPSCCTTSRSPCAFGVLLRAEVEGVASAEQAAVADALDRLRLNRARYADALLADPREHPDLWEIDSALTALVDRMLVELDTTTHAQLWQ